MEINNTLRNIFNQNRRRPPVNREGYSTRNITMDEYHNQEEESLNMQNYHTRPVDTENSLTNSSGLMEALRTIESRELDDRMQQNILSEASRPRGVVLHNGGLTFENNSIFNEIDYSLDDNNFWQSGMISGITYSPDRKSDIEKRKSSQREEEKVKEYYEVKEITMNKKSKEEIENDIIENRNNQAEGLYEFKIFKLIRRENLKYNGGERIYKSKEITMHNVYYQLQKNSLENLVMLRRYYILNAEGQIFHEGFVFVETIKDNSNLRISIEKDIDKIDEGFKEEDCYVENKAPDKYDEIYEFQSNSEYKKFKKAKDRFLNLSPTYYEDKFEKDSKNISMNINTLKVDIQTECVAIVEEQQFKEYFSQEHRKSFDIEVGNSYEVDSIVIGSYSNKSSMNFGYESIENSFHKGKRKITEIRKEKRNKSYDLDFNARPSNWMNTNIPSGYMTFGEARSNMSRNSTSSKYQSEMNYYLDALFEVNYLSLFEIKNIKIISKKDSLLVITFNKEPNYTRNIISMFFENINKKQKHNYIEIEDFSNMVSLPELNED